MNTRIPFLLIVLAVMVLVLPGSATSDVKDTEEPATAEFEQLIELERAIHFLSPTGEDVVVPPGFYAMEAGNEALRLIPDDEQKSQPITIQAEATPHTESLEVVSPISTKINEDMHVVALLLPEGKILQAVGSYSGVRARGSKKKKGGFRYRGRRIILKPRIEFITTSSSIKGEKKELRVGEQVFIKGANFGAFRKGKGVGEVLIRGRFRNNVPVAALKVENWKSTTIKARIQSELIKTRVKDQRSVKIYIKTANGNSSGAWTIPFRAARQTWWLEYKDTAVWVRRCSKEANLSFCNEKVRTDLPVLFSGSCNLSDNPPIWKGRVATIWARHKNCNLDADWDGDRDDVQDIYKITLKNGWVFKEIRPEEWRSSTDERISMPRFKELKKVIGKSEWRPEIKWEISPNDSIFYAYWVQIEGPRGFSFK